jgi:large repetitive protein
MTRPWLPPVGVRIAIVVLLLLPSPAVVASADASSQRRADRSETRSEESVRVGAGSGGSTLGAAAPVPGTTFLGSPGYGKLVIPLGDGRVLVAGGGDGPVTRDAQLYDPDTETFIATGPLGIGRSAPGAVRLQDGRVLVAGGSTEIDDEWSTLDSAEVYDPAAGTFSPTGSMAAARVAPSATLLPDGRVLVAGGHVEGGTWRPVASTEVFDPGTGTFATTGSVSTPRWGHTATLLPDGRVLVVGGMGPQGPLSSAELFDPATGTFRPTGNLEVPRRRHTATLLADGRVLVVGGVGPRASTLASAELYDPATGRFSGTGAMRQARSDHAATLLPDGPVLISGGMSERPTRSLAGAELYDPRTGRFRPTGSMTRSRANHAAVLLPDGRVLLVTGEGHVGHGATYFGEIAVDSADLYDPATGRFRRTGPATLLTRDRDVRPTATLLRDGRVLIAGGARKPCPDSGFTLCPVDTTVEIFDPSTGRFKAAGASGVDAWAAAALHDGSVLLVDRDGDAAALYHPRSGRFTHLRLPGDLGGPTAITLRDGRVLIVGFRDAAIYDPATGRASRTGRMRVARQEAAAALLRDGRVLVAGGHEPGEWVPESEYASAEAYDPATGRFRLIGRMTKRLGWATATRLADGRVLVVGDEDDPTSELFDPATDRFSASGPMRVPRTYFSATPLADGRVLVAGGSVPEGTSGAAAELYDPATGTFSPTGSMTIARNFQTATRLADGRVLIASRVRAELYDPVAGTFTETRLVETPTS